MQISHLTVARFDKINIIHRGRNVFVANVTVNRRREFSFKLLKKFESEIQIAEAYLVDSSFFAMTFIWMYHR